MRSEITAFLPMPPCCPHCWGFMGLKDSESWTLLRGRQLTRYIYQCEDCGHAFSRIVQENSTTMAAATEAAGAVPTM